MGSSQRFTVAGRTLSLLAATAVTAGLLPEELRVAYGLPWSAARQRRFTRTLQALTAVYRLLPRRIRHWPSRSLLKRAG